MDNILKLINEANYAIIDIEAIQLQQYRQFWKGVYSKHHHCLRKVAILCKNGDYGCEEARPCIKFGKMDDKERKSFDYNRWRVHRLPFYPSNRRDPTCAQMLQNVRSFLKIKNINLILHKGGDIERDLAEKLGYDHVNLELIGVPAAPNHNPLQEVYFYQDCLNKILRN